MTVARSLRARIARLRRCQQGGATIEFALVGTVFFWVLFGVLELGAMLVMSNALDDAVSDAARLVRTGQVEKNRITQAQMKRFICENLPFGGDCGARLMMDMKRYPDFASVRAPTPPTRDSDGNVNFDENYEPGRPKEVVLFRTYYRWKFATPFMGRFLANFGGDEYLLASAAAFRNEPYEQK